MRLDCKLLSTLNTVPSLLVENPDKDLSKPGILAEP